MVLFVVGVFFMSDVSWWFVLCYVLRLLCSVSVLVKFVLSRCFVISVVVILFGYE